MAQHASYTKKYEGSGNSSVIDIYAFDDGTNDVRLVATVKYYQGNYNGCSAGEKTAVDGAAVTLTALRAAAATSAMTNLN